MFMLAPLDVESDDYLGYWMAIRNDLLASIWKEVIAPVETFVREKFPQAANGVLEAPIRYIASETAASYRAQAMMRYEQSGMEAASDPDGNSAVSFFDSRMASYIYVTDDTPVPTKVPDDIEDPAYTIMIRDGEQMPCVVTIGFQSAPDMRRLESDIYGFFIGHLCKRLESLFYTSFPAVHFKNTSGEFLMKFDPEDGVEYTDEDVNTFLPDSHLVFLRMENMTMRPLDTTIINQVSNTTRILSEALNKRNLTFFDALKTARENGFDFASFANAYPPLLSVWMRPQIGNVYCSWSVYKNGKHFDEAGSEMYHNEDPAWFLNMWYSLLSEMNSENNTAKWTVVITDMIHC